MRATLALAMLSLIAAPAMAQERGEAAGDIIVRGERIEDVPAREVTRQARSITRMGKFHDEPLARVESRICPGVIGIRRDYAEIMIGRIRGIAERYGINGASEESCSPNFVILISEDGRAELAEFQRRHGYLSETLSVSEQRELIEDDGPVRVWWTVETRMRNGMPVARRRNLVDIPVGRIEGGQSRISLGSRQDIVATLVVFDREAIKGKTLVQLTDYAIMRGLARTRDVEGEAALNTILGLFSGGDAQGLTEFDRAYLASLYDGVPYLPAAAKLLRVDDKLREELAE